MNFRATSFVLLLSLLAACAKVTVRHVPNSNPTQRIKEEGVYYALPRTVVRVQIALEKSKAEPAPFMMFAPIFAPAGQALCASPNDCRVMKESVRFSLADGATFATFGEPDPEHVYLVKLSGRGTLDQTLAMEWTETGVPTSATSSVTNRTVEVALAGVKLATGLGTKVLLAPQGEGTAPQAAAPTGETASTPKACGGVESTNDGWIISELRKIGEHTVASQFVANYCDMPAKARNEFSRSTDTALLVRAVSAFNERVLPYVRRRLELLTQPSAVLDPVSLIDRLERLIDDENRSLFLGAAVKALWKPVFEVRDLELTPQGDKAPLFVTLLNLDSTNGPCLRTPLAPDSTPMPANFAGPGLCCDEKVQAHPPVKLSVELYPESGQLFEVIKRGAENAPDDERSFRYRIPAQVQAHVAFKERSIGAAVFSMAQFGLCVSLPARRWSKSLSYELAFIEATGGLRSFKLGKTGGVDAATIEALSEAGSTVIDARNKRREAAQAEAEAAALASDELTLLTRQHTLLKLRDEICEIQKKYGLACTEP